MPRPQLHVPSEPHCKAILNTVLKLLPIHSLIFLKTDKLTKSQQTPKHVLELSRLSWLTSGVHNSALNVVWFGVGFFWSGSLRQAKGLPMLYFSLEKWVPICSTTGSLFWLTSCIYSSFLDSGRAAEELLKLREVCRTATFWFCDSHHF